MKKIINSTIAIMIAFFITSSISIASDRDLIGQILGQGLGAYGGAKLCGGGAAKQIACGTVGSLLGSRLLNSNHTQNSRQYQQNNTYNRPAYSQHYTVHAPKYTQDCRNVAVAMPNGTYGTGLMCRMANGYWQVITVTPVR